MIYPQLTPPIKIAAFLFSQPLNDILNQQYNIVGALTQRTGPILNTFLAN